MKNKKLKRLIRIKESKSIVDEILDKKTKEDIIEKTYDSLIDYIVEKYLYLKNIDYDYLDSIVQYYIEEELSFLDANIDEETIEEIKKEIIEEVIKRIEE
ncbi:MAG: hypothetical protein QXO40_03870 [Candidatus Aenigmatarchaeota archaeon]